MSLRVQKGTVSYKWLATVVMVVALVAQPLYTFVASNTAGAEAVVEDNRISGITTYDELKAAFENPSYRYIELAPGVTITAPESLLIARNGVVFNGNDSTIARADDGAGWHGAYALKVWRASAVTINSLRTTGGDAGVLVSSSGVRFTGNTHNNGHEFGGIEISRSTSAGAPNSTVVMEGGLWNQAASESNGVPAIWVVNGEGTFSHSGLLQPLYKATHVKADQTQYYLRQANTGTVATNVTKNTTYASLQAAIDAASTGDQLRLEANVTLGAAVQVNKAVSIDGNDKTLTTNWTNVSVTNNAALLITSNNVSVSNLSVVGAKVSYLHGINISGAQGVRLTNITARDSAAGINVGYSNVAVNGLTTSGNIWYGVGLDKSSTLDITGAISQTDAFQVVNDNTSTSTFVDSSNQYLTVAESGVKRVYALGVLAAPTLVSPAADAVVNGQNQPLVNSWTGVVGATKYRYESYNNDTATSLRWIEVFTTTSKSATNVSDTTFWWRVKAINAFGDESEWSELRKVTVDNTAPAAPVISVNGQQGSFYTNQLAANATWTQPSSDTVRYDYRYYNTVPTSDHNGEANAWINPNLTSTSYSGVFNQGEGTHYMSVRAYDQAGNVSGWSTPVVVTYDKTPPVFSVANGSVITASSTIISITDINLDSVSVNGSPVTLATPNQLTIVGEGTYEITASDKAGNVATVTITLSNPVQVTISPIAKSLTGLPTISGSAVRADASIPSGETVTIEIVDEDGAVVRTLKPVVSTTGAWTVTLATVLANGTYTVRSSGATTGVSLEVSRLNDAPIPTPSTPLAPVGGGPTGAGAPNTLIVADTSTDSDTDSNAAVLGAQTTRNGGEAAATVAALPTAEGWKIFGVLWYWWLLAIAAIAAIWWLIAARRRRTQNEN